jgi:hypothetical protein
MICKGAGETKISLHLFMNCPSILAICNCMQKWLLIYIIYDHIYFHYCFLAHQAKGHVSFCHHLASVVVRPSYTFTFESSPLKPLNQIKPNLAGMVLGWVPFKNVSDRPALHSRWLLVLKIEISSIVHCCFIINVNELKFLLQLHGN